MADKSHDVVSILPATPQDFPQLANLAVTAMSVELIHRVVFPSNNPLDASPQARNVLSLLHRLYSQGAWIGKAVFKPDNTDVHQQAEETIAGLALMYIKNENGSIQGSPRQQRVHGEANEQAYQAHQTLPGLSMQATEMDSRFLDRVRKGVKPLYDEWLGGKKHIHLQYLMTRPDVQRLGIGSALMSRGFEDLLADEHQLPVWVVTQHSGYGMYLKRGFHETGHVDVDMAEIMGPHRGFGTHRTYCMIKLPTGARLDD